MIIRFTSGIAILLFTFLLPIFVESACGEQDSCHHFSLVYVCACIVCACICQDLCMDFKIIWHSCSPLGLEVPFENLFRYVEGQGHT